MILIKTQSDCHLLKEKSLGNPKFANELLFPKIKGNLKEFCCDFICNPLIKSLLDLLTYSTIEIFLFSIEDSLNVICLSEPGSRIIQKLIEKLY